MQETGSGHVPSTLPDSNFVVLVRTPKQTIDGAEQQSRFLLDPENRKVSRSFWDWKFLMEIDLKKALKKSFALITQKLDMSTAKHAKTLPREIERRRRRRRNRRGRQRWQLREPWFVLLGCRGRNIQISAFFRRHALRKKVKNEEETLETLNQTEQMVYRYRACIDCLVGSESSDYFFRNCCLCY